MDRRDLPREATLGKEVIGIPKEKQETIPTNVSRSIQKLTKEKNEFGGSLDFAPQYLEKVEIVQGDEQSVTNILPINKQYEVDFHTHPYSQKVGEDRPRAERNARLLMTMPSRMDCEAAVIRAKNNKTQHFLIYPENGRPIEIFVKDSKKYRNFENESHDDRKKVLDTAWEKTQAESKLITTEQKADPSKLQMERDSKDLKKHWKKNLQEKTGLGFKYINLTKLKIIPRESMSAITKEQKEKAEAKMKKEQESEGKRKLREYEKNRKKGRKTEKGLKSRQTPEDVKTHLQHIKKKERKEKETRAKKPPKEPSQKGEKPKPKKEPKQRKERKEQKEQKEPKPKKEPKSRKEKQEKKERKQKK